MSRSIVDALHTLVHRKSKKIGFPKNKRIGYVYQELADDLSSVAGQEPAWTGDYIRSVVLGNHVASDMLCAAIDAMNKPPKPPPRPDEIAKRSLVLHATLDELHMIQSRYNPRERTERLKRRS